MKNTIQRKRRAIRSKEVEKETIQGVNDEYIHIFLDDPHYDVTREGKVLTERDRGGHVKKGEWREFSLHTNADGHLSIRYRTRGIDKNLSLPRVVYQKFIGKLDQYLVVGHKDGDITNNQASNLVLESRGDNNLKQFKEFGREGVKGNVKINQTIAESLRKLHSRGWSYNRLAKRFKLSKTTVCYAVKGLTWNDDKAPIKDFSNKKLDEETVKAIRDERKKGKPYQKIADEFRVAKTTVINIVKNRIYKGNE